MGNNISWGPLTGVKSTPGGLSSTFRYIRDSFEKDSEKWYLDGKLHRVNAPAVKFSEGTKAWYQHGRLHRLDGPAIAYSDGGYEWYKDGIYHRTDGPAVYYPGGATLWFVDGWMINSYRKFQQKTKCSNDLIIFLKLKYGNLMP